MWLVDNYKIKITKVKDLYTAVLLVDDKIQTKFKSKRGYKTKQRLKTHMHDVILSEFIMKNNQRNKKATKSGNATNAMHKLYGYWTLETIVTTPDENGYTVECILYFLGEIFDDIQVTRKFRDNVEAIQYYKDIVITSYILNKASKDANFVMDIRYLQSKFAQEKLVDKMLYDNFDSITYLTTIDLIKMLERYGIRSPRDTDSVNKRDLEEFDKYINALNTVMIKRLRSLKFDADFNSSNIKHHDEIEKDPFCNNLIYTRHPVYAAEKMVKDGKVFARTFKSTYLDVVDDSILKVKYPHYNLKQRNLQPSIINLSNDVVGLFGDSEFKSYSADFTSQINQEDESFYKFWSKERPKQYTEWRDDYTDITEDDMPFFV